MTHDELKALIENKFNNQSPLHDAQIVNALYRVVELHKPKDEIIGMGVNFEGVTTSLSSQLRCTCSQLYPCRTIEAIEKELR